MEILERHGLPFFLYRNRSRKMFPAGILLCAVFLYVMSLFIWNIHIEGNYSRTTDVILDYLETEQVVHGMRKSQWIARKSSLCFALNSRISSGCRRR